MKKRIVKLIAAFAFVALAFGNGMVISDASSNDISFKKLMSTNSANAEFQVGQWWYKTLIPGSWYQCYNGGMLCCPGFDCN
jgi:hypothetical protein